MALLYGIGSFDFLTLGLTPERLLPVEPMEFTLAGESTSKTSTKFKDGILVTAGTAQAGETFTLTIGIEAVNWLSLQFAYGELASTTASIALPTLKYATIPALTPFEIIDTDLTSLVVYATDLASGIPLTRVVGAPAATGEFQVVTGTTRLVFHSSDAGKAIAYRTFKAYTDVSTIGVEAVATTLSNFQFSGVCYNDEEKYELVIPKMGKTNIPSLGISDVTKLDVEFQLALTGSNRKVFQLIKLPA